MSKKVKPTSNSKELLKLQKTIENLEKQCKEHEEIAKRAQSDYIRLKMDMDALITRTEEQKKMLTIESLVKVSQKILPFVGQLKHTVASMSEEINDSSWGSWIVLIYEKMLQSLEQLHIKTITANKWDEPDLTKHVPISTQPVDDKKLQWKILTEIEQWYIYKKDWKETVLVPSKVIVWQ